MPIVLGSTASWKHVPHLAKKRKDGPSRRSGPKEEGDQVEGLGKKRKDGPLEEKDQRCGDTTGRGRLVGAGLADLLPANRLHPESAKESPLLEKESKT